MVLLFCPSKVLLFLCFSETANFSVTVTASLGPVTLSGLLLFYSGFSETAFFIVRVPASLIPSPLYFVFLCFTVPASLGQSFAGPGFSGSLPLFSRGAWFT